MAENGTEFKIDIPVEGGDKIDAASRSVEALAVQLENASKAVSAGEKSYRQAETTADRAAKAYEHVGLALEVQRGKLEAASKANDSRAVERAAAKLRELTDRQTEAATKAERAKTSLENEARALDSLKEAAEKAKKNLKAAQDSELNFEGIKRGLSKIGGPLADLANRGLEAASGFEKLVKNLGSAGKYLAIAGGIGVVVAAVVALAVSLAATTAKVLEYTVSLADAERTQLLLAQGAARSVEGGKQLFEEVIKVSKALPISREEVSQLGKNFAAAGLRGKDLSNAIERAAVWSARLKFGPNFEDQMLSLSEQSKVLQLNIAGIFGGLKIDGLLKGVAKLVALFDDSTASGRALKAIFESLFQPIVDSLASAAPKVERFFLYLELYALKALIAIKPYGSLIAKIGEAFLIGAAIIGGVFATALAAVVVQLAVVVAEIGAVIFAIVKLVQIGPAIISGLVKGIAEGADKVYDALFGVVDKAIKGVKKFLGIASPSKVMADEVGFQMGAGTQRGIERSSGGVKGALENMAAVPGAVSTPAQRAETSSKSGTGASVSGNTFNLYGVEGADDAVKRIGELMTRLLEGDAAQLGALAPAS